MFTQADRSEGGKTTAEIRKFAANEEHAEWLSKIMGWHYEGASIGDIAGWVADLQRQKLGRHNMNRQKIWRIIRREKEKLQPSVSRQPGSTPAPTYELPGSEAKIEELAERFANGQALFHPEDIRYDTNADRFISSFSKRSTADSMHERRW